MKFKRESKISVDVNLTPLIDVVFLLLIFFMVSTSFVRESHLAINLPSAQESRPLTEEDIGLEVLVNQNGSYQIDDTPVVTFGAANHREIVASALKNLSQGNVDQPITVTADAAAPYNAVVTLMDIAGELGFSRIQLTTQDESITIPLSAN